MRGMLTVVVASSVMWAAPVASAAERAACPPEVAQADAMVARAREALKAGRAEGSQEAGTRTPDPGSTAGVTPPVTPGSGYGGGRSPLAGPAAPPERTAQGEPASGAQRGLATSAISDIKPWAPSPGDKTLSARAAQARRLATQARRLCRAGKMDEAKGKALEAITVLEASK